MNDATLYKVLNEDGSAFHGGHGKWHLPAHGRPGKWMPPIKNIALCSRGYHVVTLAQLPRWLGPAIFTVAVRGERIDDGEKSVVSEARLISRTPWDERTARLFAADCAEHVLPIFLKVRPDDDRPAKAIEAARRYARSEITAAAGDAAWAAAGDAAGAAAWDAARAAAWAAERLWQSNLLAKYLSGKKS